MIATVVRQLTDAPARRHVVTIGNFDGVHAGHQFLLGEVVRQAARRGVASGVVTFDPLPAEVLAAERAPRRLTTTEDRLTAIASCGIDTIVAMTFDHELARRSAEEFIDDLARSLRPVEIIVGEDFAFGYQRRGNPALLRRLGERHDFAVTVVRRMDQDRAEVSSTAIRRLIAAGEVDRAGALLRRPVSVRERVVRGNQRGRELGYPTANLLPDGRLALPPDGIYAGHAALDRLRPLWPSLIYVGTRPTFDESTRVVEVHLLDFDGDLYGRELLVLFARQVRGDERFESAGALVEQMRRDERQAREMLAELPGGWPGERALAMLGVGSVTTW